MIATGSAPLIPPIDGIGAIPYLTNETVFSIERLPARLIVIGAGPIGIEMAQAFRRLASEVQVIASTERILPRDDGELSTLLQAQLEHEGIRFLLDRRAVKAERAGDAMRIGVEAGSAQAVEGDAVLIAAGRRSAFEDLRLENAGVRVNQRGVIVDRRCRTSARHIYASGDVTGLYRFTHMAEHMSKAAVTKALLHVPISMDTRGVTWCVLVQREMENWRFPLASIPLFFGGPAGRTARAASGDC